MSRFTKADAVELERLLDKLSEREYAWWLNWIMMGRPMGMGLWEYISLHIRTPREQAREQPR